MSRLIGPDNAIAWVQVQLRGGRRSLVRNTVTYAAIIIALIVVSLQLVDQPVVEIWRGWALAILALQAVALLLLANGRIASAISQDLNGGMIESHRLMPVAPGHAIAGYIAGASSQALCVIPVNLLIGGGAVVNAGFSLDVWLVANLLLFAFAGLTWTVSAFVAACFRKNLLGVGISLPFLLSMGRTGAIGLFPGVFLLTTPLLGNTIFDLHTNPLGAKGGYIAVAVLAQMAVGSIFFVGASRKYRRSEDVALTPALGLLLLAIWVVLSWGAIALWADFRPAYLRASEFDEASQLLAAQIVGLLLAFIPVFAASEQSVAWLQRRLSAEAEPELRPFRDEWIVLGAAALLMPLSFRPDALTHGAQIALARTIAAGAIVFLHLAAMNWVRRALRYYTAKVNGLVLLLLAVLWCAPLLADAIRHVSVTETPDPSFTLISCLSPVGALYGLAYKLHFTLILPGIIFQAAVAGISGAFYAMTHPARRRDALKRPAVT